MKSKHHWQAIYNSKVTTDVSWYQAEALSSLKLIDHCSVAKTAEIIDVGSGASLLIDGLLDRGYERITALDISEAALRVTQDRLGERASTVKWIVSDVTTASLPKNQFDVWHDRAVFHFLTNAKDRSAYTELMRNSLKNGSHVIMATFALGGPPKCSGLDVSRYDANSLKKELGEGFDLLESFQEAHKTPFGTEQEFLFCRFRKA